jgi:hypothetical protein
MFSHLSQPMARYGPYIFMLQRKEIDDYFEEGDLIRMFDVANPVFHNP